MIILGRRQGIKDVYATLDDLVTTSGSLQSQIDNHVHDDRYYTETEIDNMLASASGVGPTDFLSLIDTPTTYSGFENYYVGVNASGTGLIFIPDSDGSQSGVTPIVSGTSSLDVTYNTPFDDTDYALVLTLESKVGNYSNFPLMIEEKTTTGFTASFVGDIDHDNYHLNWIATYGMVNPTSCAICEVVEDTTPELGGNLEVGSNLLLLETTPDNDTIHGYDIGYSGEASEVYVFDNPTGFACPLYIKSDGTWAATTAASGTTSMPCGALALEEDDQAVKTVLWEGNIRKSTWNWTPGDIIYVSTVEGAIANAKPTGGAWVQPIGYAISQDTIKFDPNFDPNDRNLHFYWDDSNSELVMESRVVGVDPIKDSHLTTKSYVDDAITTLSGLISTISGGGITDHGSLLGLLDNDHPQYLTRTDFTTYSGAIVDQIPTDYYTTGQVDNLLSYKEDSFLEVYGGDF